MVVPRFEYVAPATVEEAVLVLVDGGPGTRVMAGGTDLLVRIRHRMAFPQRIVSLKRISGLEAIVFDKKRGLTIGATALLADVAAHPQIRRHYPTVAGRRRDRQCTGAQHGHRGGQPVQRPRHRGQCPDPVAMGASVNIAGPEGGRSLPLDQFFQGPGVTALEKGEIVTSVFVPIPPAGSGTAYLSLSQRGKLDCSAVGVGTMVVLKRDRCIDARLVVGACAPVPMRTPKAEKQLIGKKMTDTLIRSVAKTASRETAPIDDLRPAQPIAGKW